MRSRHVGIFSSRKNACSSRENVFVAEKCLQVALGFFVAGPCPARLPIMQGTYQELEACCSTPCPDAPRGAFSGLVAGVGGPGVGALVDELGGRGWWLELVRNRLAPGLCIHEASPERRAARRRAPTHRGAFSGLSIREASPERRAARRRGFVGDPRGRGEGEPPP